eukprot:5014429-Pleurochrysis_carterae.AAC.1
MEGRGEKELRRREGAKKARAGGRLRLRWKARGRRRGSARASASASASARARANERNRVSERAYEIDRTEVHWRCGYARACGNRPGRGCRWRRTARASPCCRLACPLCLWARGRGGARCTAARATSRGTASCTATRA